MEVRCDKCQARYRVDDARIGPQGLTMRCGKCQNVFRVTRTGPGAKPSPSAAPGATAPATPTGTPAAPKPAPSSAPGDEAAGRTMMFQTGNIKPAPQKKQEPEAGATMIFGQVARPAAPAPKPVPAQKPADNGAGATMVFGQSPLANQPPPTPKTVVPVRPAPEPQPGAAPAPGTLPEQRVAQEPPEEETDRPQEEPAAGESAQEQVEPEPPRRQGAFDKAPPRALFVAVGAVLAVVLIGFVTVLALKLFGRHPPPPAAVEALTSAQEEAGKDTLASLVAAEDKAKGALDLAGARSDFPQASAALARIEVQWADALHDQASLPGPDAARVSELGTQAQTHLTNAYDVLREAVKADPKSADLQLALADYYRAKRSGSNMNKALKAAQAQGADDAALALVQGMALAQEEDGAQKAIPRLKAAVAANAQSARVHFRLALAYLAVQDVALASAELKETLRISPQHERARAALEQLATANANGK